MYTSTAQLCEAFAQRFLSFPSFQPFVQPFVQLLVQPLELSPDRRFFKLLELEYDHNYWNFTTFGVLLMPMILFLNVHRVFGQCLFSRLTLFNNEALNICHLGTTSSALLDSRLYRT